MSKPPGGIELFINRQLFLFQRTNKTFISRYRKLKITICNIILFKTLGIGGSHAVARHKKGGNDADYEHKKHQTFSKLCRHEA